MTQHESVESRQQLMAVAREIGVSERQVRRWRGQGLLPKVIEQEWRGRGKGSTTWYPAGSCRQLKEVARWFKRDRRVDVVRWVLWCNGFEVDPDPHDRIVAGLRRRSGRLRPGEPEPALEDVDEGDPQDFVGRFTDMLHEAAQAAKSLDPADGQDLGSLLAKIAARPGHSSNPPRVGQPLGELDQLVTEALKGWQVSDLEPWLTAERMAQLRERAALFYRLWAPDRADREPLPPRILVAVIVLNSIGIPIGVVIDYLMHHPEANDAGRKLRDWILDDSVWRKPHRRTLQETFE